MTLRRFADLAAAPWRNGLGISRDVVTVASGDGALLWQVSLAELAGDCDFSDYAGFDRVFTPVLGEGITLSHDDGPFTLSPLLVPRAFPGEARTRCRVGGGTGRAFNVVTARGRHSAEVLVLRLAAGDPLPSGTAVHCWSGELRSSDGSAGPGDTLLDAAAIAACMSVALLVRISPA